MRLMTGDVIECRDEEEQHAVGAVLESIGYLITYGQNEPGQIWIIIDGNERVKE